MFFILKFGLLKGFSRSLGVTVNTLVGDGLSSEIHWLRRHNVIMWKRAKQNGDTQTGVLLFIMINKTKILKKLVGLLNKNIHVFFFT